MTNEYYIIFLIYGLYFIRTIKIIDTNNLLLVYNCKNLTVSFPIGYLQFEDKSFIFLNIFHFYMPTYQINTKYQAHNNYTLKNKLKLYSTRLYKILPNIIIIWVISFIILPISLYFMHQFFLIFAFILLYLSILILCINLWLHKKSYQLDNKQYISLIIDYILCPPFAINTIRDISFITPLIE